MIKLKIQYVIRYDTFLLLKSFKFYKNLPPNTVKLRVSYVYICQRSWNRGRCAKVLLRENEGMTETDHRHSATIWKQEYPERCLQGILY